MLVHTYPFKPVRKSGHVQSPGWQPNLLVAWHVIWQYGTKKEYGYTQHWINVLTTVIKQHRTHQLAADPCGIVSLWVLWVMLWLRFLSLQSWQSDILHGREENVMSKCSWWGSRCTIHVFTRSSPLAGSLQYIEQPQKLNTLMDHVPHWHKHEKGSAVRFWDTLIQNKATISVKIGCKGTCD